MDYFDFLWQRSLKRLVFFPILLPISPLSRFFCKLLPRPISPPLLHFSPSPPLPFSPRSMFFCEFLPQPISLPRIYRSEMMRRFVLLVSPREPDLVTITGLLILNLGMDRLLGLSRNSFLLLFTSSSPPPPCPSPVISLHSSLILV